MRNYRFEVGMSICWLVLVIAYYVALQARHPTTVYPLNLMISTRAAAWDIVIYLFIGTVIWGLIYLITRALRMTKRFGWRSVVLWSTVVQGSAHAILMVAGQ